MVGLVFMQPSLRTRVGFEVAAARLGWKSVLVAQQRASAVSMAESVEDTLRVVAEMSDLVVARLEQSASGIVSELPVPFVNGGDSGSEAEHPTQALIDLYTIERERGPVAGLHVAICGDLRLRATRSLLRLMATRRPRRLSVVTVPGLLSGVAASHLPETLTDQRTLHELSDVDVLYVAGISHRSIPEDQRDLLRVTADVVASMPAASIVISPMPIIDEMDAVARHDPRCRFFEQCANGVFVRMALLAQLC